MAAWKQLLVALVILLGGAVAWVAFFPGAPQLMARWGIDWAQASVPPSAGPQGAGAQQAGGQRRQGGGAPRTMVVTAPVVAAKINDRLSAIGTGNATSSVVVNPYAAGRLTEVLVRSGAVVKAGDVIARLDSDAEEIALDRARIAVNDAKSKLERVNALRASNTVTAVQVTEVQLVLSNAELARRDAELTLERRSIRAPISGIVGIMPIEAGNYVTTQTAIATIDDRSTIKVDFWVAERYADVVKVGAPLTATAIARPERVLEGTVSAVDNRLDEASRTLRVQAEIANTDDSLRAGMSFQVAMRFPGDTYPAVSPLAIQWGSDGAYVWALRDGRARRTPVRIIQRNTDSVLVDGELRGGETVVTEGIHAVREGAELLIAGAQPSSPAGGT